MNNQINTLIEFYYEEKNSLQNLIKDYLAEEEYLLAHYHSNAVAQLNRRLQTLHNLGDNLYDAKQHKQRIISFLEKKIEKAGVENTIGYFSKELRKEKEALEKLNQVPPKATTEEETSLLENIFIRLLDREIKNVKLILKKKDNFSLAFARTGKALKVTLPHVKQHIKKWTLHDENLYVFKRIGFNITENGSKLVLILEGGKQEIITKLKNILSKIVFEIFYFKEFENESYIQYREKGHR